jgi:S1-C subfamily serine protease
VTVDHTTVSRFDDYKLCEFLTPRWITTAAEREVIVIELDKRNLTCNGTFPQRNLNRTAESPPPQPSTPQPPKSSGAIAAGTGFLFSSSDYVITSYHVVHGSKSISVRFTNGEQIDATIAVKDTNNDIAILKLSKSPRSRQNIITLGDSSSVRTGDRVFTYGFPLVDLLGNKEPRYSEGFVNSLSGISNDPRVFQVSIPIQPGNSGGPIFNEKGELIGIATSSIDSVQTQKVFGATPQNVNFAIKSSHINSLLPNLPDTFIKQKGIVPVPIEQSSFKERVKNDIVLVEAVPEFKPTVVKRDYEEEERLRKEQDVLQRERELEQRERELNRREAQQNNNWEQRSRRDQRRINRTGPCYGGMPANSDGSCDIGPLRKRNNKPKGNFNFNFRIGK